MTTLDTPAPADRAARLLDRTLAGPGAGRTNYLEPKGDPGFFGPDSMAWKVHANPIALAIGGVAAVILELAEPRVRSGVWDHSIFRTDPLTRMQRTGEATLITTYGPTKAAQARVDMVTRMHARVSGVTPEGQAYTALEPELMTWVHITAGWGFLNAYRRYVEPGMSLADQDRYHAEGGRLGRAFGAVDPPGSVAEVDAWFDRMRPKLVPHPIIGEFLHIVSTTSPLGLAGRALQPLVVQAAIDLLPRDLVRKLELPANGLGLAAAKPLLRGLALAAGRAPGEVVRQAHARVGRRLA
ncbi:oxygenase MpaB family protein [Phenylobacterium sp.]|uniref:oxygenase MpaB family protein n=1 Tax=Phenylobacterium sp. TaxID=1871053 RepID=UPI002F95BD4E